MKERKKLGRGLDEISHLFLSSEEEPSAEKEESTRLISAVSGLGGLEKPFLLGNLALKLATEGHRVAVLSFNSTVPTVNFLLNVPSGEPVLQLAEDGRGFDNAVVEGPMGVQLVTAGGDLSNVACLRSDRREAVIAWLKELEDKNDFLFLDVASILGPAVLPLDLTAREVMVLASPDVAGMLNAYRIIKAVLTANRTAQLGLIACRVRTMVEAKAVYEKMVAVTRKYLGASIDNWGFVYDDLNIPRSIWRRTPIALLPAGSRAGECLGDIAHRIIDGGATPSPAVESVPSGFQGAGQSSEPASDWNGPRLE